MSGYEISSLLLDTGTGGYWFWWARSWQIPLRADHWKVHNPVIRDEKKAGGGDNSPSCPLPAWVNSQSVADSDEIGSLADTAQVSDVCEYYFEQDFILSRLQVLLTNHQFSQRSLLLTPMTPWLPMQKSILGMFRRLLCISDMSISLFPVFVNIFIWKWRLLFADKIFGKLSVWLWIVFWNIAEFDQKNVNF